MTGKMKIVSCKCRLFAQINLARMIHVQLRSTMPIAFKESSKRHVVANFNFHQDKFTLKHKLKHAAYLVSDQHPRNIHACQRRLIPKSRHVLKTKMPPGVLISSILTGNNTPRTEPQLVQRRILTDVNVVYILSKLN